MVVTLLGLIVGLAGGCGFGLMASATLSSLIDATDPMAFAPIPATLIAVVGGETKLCNLLCLGRK